MAKSVFFADGNCGGNCGGNCAGTVRELCGNCHPPPRPPSSRQLVQGAQSAQGAASHYLYCGGAPIFIATSMADIEALEEAGGGDASMLLRRLNAVHSLAGVAKLSAHNPERAACFARLVAHHRS